MSPVLVRSLHVGPRTVVLGLALLAGAACSESTRPEPVKQGTLVVVVQSPLLATTVITRLRVRVVYERQAASGVRRRELVETRPRVQLPPGTTDVRVVVPITPCLTDQQRTVDVDGGCEVEAEVTTLDAGGAPVGTVVSAPVVLHPKTEARTPSMLLTLP